MKIKLQSNDSIACIHICLAWKVRLKNTIDLLLFYGEHFYGFSESDILPPMTLLHAKPETFNQTSPCFWEER